MNVKTKHKIVNKITAEKDRLTEKFVEINGQSEIVTIFVNLLRKNCLIENTRNDKIR